MVYTVLNKYSFRPSSLVKSEADTKIVPRNNISDCTRSANAESECVKNSPPKDEAGLEITGHLKLGTLVSYNFLNITISIPK